MMETNTTTESDLFKVIIVGAGVSGLSFANYLCKYGGNIDILIIEAKDRPGGRIHSVTVNGDGESGVLEVGAQWIHGESGPFFQKVKEADHLHALTSWEGKGDFVTPNGEKVEESIVKEICDWFDKRLEEIENYMTIDTLYENPMKWGHDSSMGSYLREEFDMYMHGKLNAEGVKVYEEKVAVFQWIMSFQRIDNCCNQMTDLSLFRWSEFEQNPGEHYNNFKSGAQSFVDKILVTELLTGNKGVRFVYNHPVEKILWNETGPEGKVKVVVDSGDSFHCDCILVTCSIGVLKATHRNLFKPELPQRLSKAIEGTGFGPLTKIFLEWEEQWWPKDFKGYQLLWPKEYLNCCDDEYAEITTSSPSVLERNWPKSITGFDPVLNCPKVLLAWLGGPEAVFVETLDSEEVALKCTETLQRFTKLNVPPPKTVLVSKWNSDKFALGAYSFRSTDGDNIPDDVTVLTEPLTRIDSTGKELPVVMFAGEALHRTHYSTLHGAYESGLAQAQKLLALLNPEATNTKQLNNSSSETNGNLEAISLPNSNSVITSSQVSPTNSISRHNSNTKVC